MKYLTDKAILLYIFLQSVFICNAQFPTPDPYPYRQPQQVLNEAKDISDKLEDYIIKWSQGLVPSSIPDSLIPNGITDSKNFYLKNPDSVTAEETWAVRYAKPINKDSLYAGIPDPRFTYLFLGTAFAPFGSKVIVEGKFPHARFFSMQISPPLNGEQYYSQRQFGTAEIAIPDIDITPLPGHSNPYKVGANRNVENRSYRVEFDLLMGNPTQLNDSAHIYPYRKNTNKRTGSLLVYQGPLGNKTLVGTPMNDHNGPWNLGCLWVRIYSPDDNTDVLGGVPMPKVYFELPNGFKYFIGSDFSVLRKRAGSTSPNKVEVSQPNPYFGPNYGWSKSFGISNGILNGIAQANGWYNQRENIRKIELGWTGRGYNQPHPANIEPHATTNNYISYVGRPLTIPPGMVAVLTGTLPTFPSTRHGESVMTAAQVRYWSIIGIDQDPFSQAPSSTVHGISDDEIIIDKKRNYVIAYSRQIDKPKNANPENGVSWVDWGTQSYLGLIMRWTCIAPEWYFPFAPHENNLNFTVADWASPLYDSTKIGLNWRRGFMQCYLPVVHYMTKQEFESIGDNVSAENVPIWVDSTYTQAGIADSRLGTVKASSVIDTTKTHEPANILDGDVTTFWSSTFGQKEASLTLDLGEIKKISAIKLYWDWIFFAKNYTISISDDGKTQTKIITALNENGQIDLYKGLRDISGRYVTISFTEYNAGFYRLAELEVYTSDCHCTTPMVSHIQENIPSTDITLLPNPSKNSIIVESNTMVNEDMYIYDLQGNMLLTAPSSGKTTTIDITTLPVGTYFLMVQHNGKSIIKTFLKI